SRRFDQLSERLLDLRWERALGRLQDRDDLRRGYLLHGGSSCLGWTSRAQNAADGSGRGGRTAAQSSTRSRTTSDRHVSRPIAGVHARAAAERESTHVDGESLE